jgi:hypothetical protein
MQNPMRARTTRTTAGEALAAAAAASRDRFLVGASGVSPTKEA